MAFLNLVLISLLTFFFYTNSSFSKEGSRFSSIGPNLSYSEGQCSVNGHEIEYQEIRLKPNSGLNLVAIENPGAQVDSSCHGNYGGTSLSQIIQRMKNQKSTFRPFAITNGGFFRSQVKSKKQMGFAPIGMLWSKTGHHQDKLMARLRLKGGDSLLVVDRRGAHRLSFKLESCSQQTCVSLNPSSDLDSKQLAFFHKKMDTQSFLKALHLAFPEMTLAAQMNMDLAGGHLDEAGRLVHYSQCQNEKAQHDRTQDDEIKAYWKCKTVARTFLCGKKDGTVSLLTTPSAYVYDIASGFRMSGSCSSECTVLFNLDGGGSTQMGYLDPKTKRFNLSGTPHGPSIFQDPKKKKSICGSLRPVDHYFAIGSYLK